MGRGGRFEKGTWARVRTEGSFTAGSWVLVDAVGPDGSLRATLFGDDGSAQLREIQLHIEDLEPATPPWVEHPSLQATPSVDR
jgi:hypothetical protein